MSRSTTLFRGKQSPQPDGRPNLEGPGALRPNKTVFDERSCDDTLKFPADVAVRATEQSCRVEVTKVPLAVHDEELTQARAGRDSQTMS